MKHLLVILLSLSLTTSCFCQTLPIIDSLITVQFKQKKYASLAVGVIRSGEIVHLSTHGYKDIEHQLKADINTSYHIASISKTVTNLAIFQLVEEEVIQLDGDINDYLPFKVINPHTPSQKITVKDLLNHRSCIIDNRDFYIPLWQTSKGDSELGLEEFLYDYLTEKGANYSLDNFIKCDGVAPFIYSNTAFALLGLIVEQVTNMSFEDYCQKNLFEPLNMQNTSWFLQNLDISNVARTYTFTDSTDLNFEGPNGYPDYPAGQLRTSLYDFAHLIKEFLLAREDLFIIHEDTRNHILPLPQQAQVGFYTWFLNPINNNLYYNHGGRDKGVRTRVMIDRNFNHGIIVFSNSDATVGALVRSIEEALFSR